MIFKNNCRYISSLIFNVTLLIKVLFVSLASDAQSHEVTPAIADILQYEDGVQLEIRLNLEALLSGIDLSNISNTDEATQSAEYDFYRAMSETDLKSDFSKIWPSIKTEIKIKQDDEFVALILENIMVEGQENFDYPRFTTIVFTTSIDPYRPFSFQWSKSYGEIVLREQGRENGFTQYLQSGIRSSDITIGEQPAYKFSEVFFQYIPVGFTHIIPKGLDHILFVVGIFFLSTKLSALFWQITFFTLAHSVTLAMASLGIVKISPSIVEPLIAASIVYVAVENFYSKTLNLRRSIIVFCFGLLHGLGFASVLAEFGLPIQQFVPALVGFNIGVELGQIIIVLILFGVIGYWFNTKNWYRKLITLPISSVVGLIGLYWFFERVI
tara:strand:+ start:1194 stop:2342 length:1149 start_codon:yes stop_codon:yes gene_type:complete